MIVRNRIQIHFCVGVGIVFDRISSDAERDPSIPRRGYSHIVELLGYTLFSTNLKGTYAHGKWAKRRRCLTARLYSLSSA